MMKKFVVYGHKFPNGKLYIGITSQKLYHRFGKDGIRYKQCTKFYRAINKYGWDSVKTIIFSCGLSEDAACKLEIELIDDLQTNTNGYNISIGGGTGLFGIGHSEETKKKISEKRIGIGHPISESCKAKISLANRGRKRSVETKEKCRIGSTGNTNARKKIICNNIVFDSITECAKYLNVPRTSLNCWVTGTRKMPEHLAKYKINYLKEI